MLPSGKSIHGEPMRISCDQALHKGQETIPTQAVASRYASGGPDLPDPPLTDAPSRNRTENLLIKSQLL